MKILNLWGAAIVSIASGVWSVRLYPRNGAERSVANKIERAADATVALLTFSQLTNHFPDDPFYGPPPANATFLQRYLLNDTFYQSGGPIILLDGGETSALDRLPYLQTGIVAELAQATHGLGIILEHRYYGESWPVTSLSTDELRWLTAEQSIADIAHFAQNVVFPSHEGENLTAPGTPWIIYGGSLAGAEVAFTIKEYGNIIYGGISSSGVVEARVGYPEWYYNIQEYAPRDCMAIVENLTAKIDHLVGLNNPVATSQLQAIFGLESLQDVRDFAITIAFPIGNPYTYPSATWQELNWDPAVGSPDFYYFCGNITYANASYDTQEVDWALSNYTGGERWTGLGNWANYIKSSIIPLCPEGVSLDSNECFGTHDRSYYANTALDRTGTRPYLYQSCTELGQYSQGAPLGRKTLLSRTVQTDYTQRWCDWSFPPGNFSSVPQNGPNVTRWNRYGGLGLQADRLAQVDGARDPWEYGCVHSPYAPKRNDSLLRPYYLIEEGGHHWDENGLGNISLEPDYIQAIHDYEVEFVRSWLADFPAWRRDRV